jgi:hypothetical protein
MCQCNMMDACSNTTWWWVVCELLPKLKTKHHDDLSNSSAKTTFRMLLNVGIMFYISSPGFLFPPSNSILNLKFPGVLVKHFR